MAKHIVDENEGTGYHNYQPNQRVRIVLVALALPADQEEAIVADYNSAILTGAMSASDAVLLDWRYIVPLEQSPIVTLGSDPSEDDAFLIAEKLGLLQLADALPKLYLMPTYNGHADDAEGPFFDEAARLRRARHLHGKIEDGVYFRLDVYRHIAPFMQAYSNGDLEREETA